LKFALQFALQVGVENEVCERELTEAVQKLGNCLSALEFVDKNKFKLASLLDGCFSLS
jgi:hypothetical protein